MVINGILQLLASSPAIRCVCREMPPVRAARDLTVVLGEPSERARAVLVVSPIVTRRVRI
jgi:hypothetical protein